MGRASSSKKVARAARTAGSTGESRNWLWFGAIGAVVALGVVMVVLSRPEPDPGADASPQVGEHWHVAYGINICGEWQQPLTDIQGHEAGIHSHGDGLMHLHPTSSRYAGSGANIEKFGETTGLTLTEDSITLPDGRTFEEGDECEGEGEEGEVRLAAWDGVDDEEPRIIEDDPAAWFPEEDRSILTIGFVPEGTELEQPPTAPRLQDPLAAERGEQPVPIEDESVPSVPEDEIVDRGPDDEAPKGEDPDEADTPPTDAP